ncbi:uncharacterized protein [Triticum aestivum]|uniref:uncharacterized protein isoform X2 n=1 Tax=Triticum aestivum TaxID=4565 RepID=UPI001D014440|nr:uncharacterized protein LOC123086095 isoform X2 [Triticum aestivum]
MAVPCIWFLYAPLNPLHRLQHTISPPWDRRRAKHHHDGGRKSKRGSSRLGAAVRMLESMHGDGIVAKEGHLPGEPRDGRRLHPRPCQQDRIKGNKDLSDVTHVIVDEVHERTILCCI